ncbi:Ribosomal RNA small subunit methyltransferase D [compost metagenome]
MRIIGGKLKGRQFNAPAKLPVRPTTDMAKGALFNILSNLYDFPVCEVLDLFSGTGSISIEFASRDTKHITSVDKHPSCIYWLKSIAQQHQLHEIDAYKADTFKFLMNDNHQYHIIFADPPYDLSNIPMIPQLVMERGLLTDNGTLIVEHPPMLKLDQLPGFTEMRKYGNSSFSFFEKAE